VFAAALAAYGAASGPRLATQSRAPHYVYLADAWLHGRLGLEGAPPNGDDWARVDTLVLTDGRTVRGRFQQDGPGGFLTTAGDTLTVAANDIRAHSATWYVSFPPLPAVLMLPLVALFGLRANDVIFTVLLAACVPPALFGLLRNLRARELSPRDDRDALWLVALFGVGSVFYYSAVIGEVWYTAHVVTCLLLVGYTAAAVEARRPATAGLLLGLAVATRALPMLLALPLFACEAWRCRRAELVRVTARFAAPLALVGAVLAWHNQVRFGNPFEFGHDYLVIRWTPRIERWGLLNYHFLSRNLAAALTLLPRFVRQPPFVLTSRHGLSLLVTTPALAYLLWPRERPLLHRPLWLTTATVALPTLLYQNDGFVQFGYRFSLDYMVFLTLLLALGARPIDRVFKVLVLVGVAVNLYGAITFSGLGTRFFYDGFFPAE
jgi:hypothetical protein